MLFVIGTAGRYLIVAGVILVIVCVGVYVAYRQSSKSSGRTGGDRRSQ